MKALCWVTATMKYEMPLAPEGFVAEDGWDDTTPRPHGPTAVLPAPEEDPPARAIPDSASATTAPAAMDTIQRLRTCIGSPFPVPKTGREPARTILFQQAQRHPGRLAPSDRSLGVRLP